MISVDEAKQLVTKNCCLLPSSLLKLEAACGLVLAEDIYAGINIPPFNQSAMDGYAFRFADLSTSKELTIIGEVAAGDNPQPGIPQFHAVRIFTGAAVPPGCDTVVMQEKTEVIENRVQIKDELLEQGRNVRLQGSEISSGEIALAKGTKLTPAAIGFLAGLGVTDVRVHPNPIVHLVITGNELQKPGTTLQHGQVYESNSVMLKAALTQLGIVDIRISYAKDTITDITNALDYALNDADLVLLTGGVSVGNYDFVLPATKACGIKQLFHKVAQRPGKPLYAGMKGEKLIVGLPGNPASVLTCFYV